MNLKLGKLPVRKDPRTIKLSSILRALPPTPDTFDIDSQWPDLRDNYMFLNDTYGDCVIAGRAHMTLRFERFEEGKIILISDDDVKGEYFSETGGLDSGLVMLNSLNKWRKNGWTAAGEPYWIHAYASVDYKNHNEVKQAIYLLNGVYLGFQVPQSAIDQFKNSQVWDVVPDDGGIQGGHCIYTLAYNSNLVAMTWGKRQPMTWAFWDKYVDEAYAIVDEKDTWLPDSPVDIEKLDGYLSEITNSPVNPEPKCHCPFGVRNKNGRIFFIVKYK